ncbi:MAG TPA: TonB-dependent receptor [Chitinophaga sp.]|uniref:TonB-dependent receptor domain-containing protein n=1 Tax=Chitinophaga sp. TaxID=1869181 RepID=UPI002B9D4EC9|nr:TonB-dependent receptor [Chitinophaga sp.]HVI49366.1 TonB-dependent receptor [Chitinophaga sp.]
MKKYFVLLGMLICYALTSHAQKSAPGGNITLKLTDKASKPLAFASVLLRRVKDSSLVKGELTTEAGDCRFDNIPTGNYFLQASQMGYTTYYAPAFQIDDAHKSISLPTITLESLSRNLQAVNVTATKPYVEHTSGKTVLNVENSVTAAGNSALDILRRAPGVQVDNNENVKIKGQAVTVMIDGKLTYLSGEDLTNMLKNTPGENIAQIEILTSPSAKYDAAGNGGIINIKTKKGKLTGINGSVNATLSQAKYGFYNANASFNWRTPKFNLYGDFSKGDRPFMVTRLYGRTSTSKGITTVFDQDVFQRNRFQRNAYKAGFDYFLTEKQTIGVLVNGFANAFSNQIYSATRLGQPAQPADSIMHAYTTNNNHFNNVAINVNYKAVLDTAGGREFSMDGDYARFNMDRRLQLNDSLFDVSMNKYRNPNGIQNLGNTRITIKSFKADLAWPMGKNGKLEAGGKVSSVLTENQFQYDSLRNGNYVRVPLQSDVFRYQEDIYAAYASYKQQIHKLGLQVGLRLENTESNGTSESVKSSVRRSYLDFFPNLNVDYKFNDKNKIGLSYSRRIERPEYSQLNPFMFYFDRYTYFKGNPYLKPQYTNNIELSYTFRDKYIATLGMSKTNDIIEEFITQDDSTKASISTMTNFTRAYVYSLQLTLPFEITKWWNSDNNINTSYIDYSFINNQNTVQYTNSFVYNINTTNTFTLPKDIKLEATAYYASPFIYGIFKGYQQYNLNLGIQKTFLDKKATVKLNVNNILRNESYHGSVINGNMNMTIFNTWQFRTVNLYISYKFGSSSIKAARERKTGTSDELKRAG